MRKLTFTTPLFIRIPRFYKVCEGNYWFIIPRMMDSSHDEI